jgi:hypothetical protein
MWPLPAGNDDSVALTPMLTSSGGHGKSKKDQGVTITNDGENIGESTNR